MRDESPRGLARAAVPWPRWPPTTGSTRRRCGDPPPTPPGVEVVVVAYGRPDCSPRRSSRAHPAGLGRGQLLLARSRHAVRRVGRSLPRPRPNGGFAAGVNLALALRLDRRPTCSCSTRTPSSLRSGPPRGPLLADPALASVGPAQVDEHGPAARVAWPFPTPVGAWLKARDSADYVRARIRDRIRADAARQGLGRSAGSTSASSSTPRRPTGPAAPTASAGGTARFPRPAEHVGAGTGGDPPVANPLPRVAGALPAQALRACEMAALALGAVVVGLAARGWWSGARSTSGPSPCRPLLPGPLRLKRATRSSRGPLLRVNGLAHARRATRPRPFHVVGYYVPQRPALALLAPSSSPSSA